MDAHRVQIGDIFSKNRKLEVPFYQRAYVWDTNQWERLLSDMEFITETNNPYFIGSIILKSTKTSVADSYSDKRIIVDGQQRLTTLVIFFKALYLLKKDPESFNFDFRIKNKEIALQTGINDEDAFEKVVDYSSTERIDNPRSSKIIDAFNYFLSNIKPDQVSPESIQKYLQFVCIEIDENEDEQKIFDTINSLGVKLTTAELLKNYFYRKEDRQQYETTWKQMFEKDDDTVAYWDKETSSGSNIRSMIDVFFDAYFQQFIESPRYSISAEDKKAYQRGEELFSSYKHFIDKYCNKDKSVVLNDLISYAQKFKDILDPDNLERKTPSSSGIERMNVIVFGLNNTTIVPYILYIEMNVLDEAEKNKMYQLLEAYLMRRMVTHENTKNYNKQFTQYIRNEIDSSEKLENALKESDDSTMKIPTNEELLFGFQNSRLPNKQTKGILYLLESAIRSEKAGVEILGFNSYSLEHLLPKKWRNNWGALDDEKARERDYKLLTLGNLAIITQKLNASIKDADWETKKRGKKGNDGLNSCSSGLFTMEYVLNQDEWNEDKIETRAKWLYSKASNIWCIGEQ